MTPPPSFKLASTQLTGQNNLPLSKPETFFSPTSPPPLQSTEEDSGFESLMTNVSDTGSLSSRLVAISPGEKDHPSQNLNRISDHKDEDSPITSPLTPLSRRQLNNIDSSGRRSVARN